MVGLPSHLGLMSVRRFCSKMRLVSLWKEPNAPSAIAVTPALFMRTLVMEARLSLCSTVELISPTSLTDINKVELPGGKSERKTFCCTYTSINSAFSVANLLQCSPDGMALQINTCSTTLQ